MLDFSAFQQPWTPPILPEEIPHGDMPGDRVSINEQHVQKANSIFPRLLPLLRSALQSSPSQRAVLSVYGGSGVGKSEIASILSFYLCSLGIGAYTLSGDNYPHRVPYYNDAERLRVFRAAGQRGLLAAGEYTEARAETLGALMRIGQEADPHMAEEHPWMAVFQQAGKEGLKRFLGTQNEIDFAEISAILARFHGGAKALFLKRMGREETALWYARVDMRGISVLVVEWTHGNNELLRGVDLPIFLNSTPQETLEHRKARARDGAADSPFTAMVLAIEQELLRSQVEKAGIIVSKGGELLTLEQYQKQLME